MTGKTTRIRAGFGLAVVCAALAIPATAQAIPASDDGPVQVKAVAVQTSDSGQGFVLRRDGSQASDVPKTGTDAGGRITDESLYTPRIVVGSATAVDDGTTFDWTDALIGAVVTSGLLALAMASAILVRRQGRLGLH